MRNTVLGLVCLSSGTQLYFNTETNPPNPPPLRSRPKHAVLRLGAQISTDSAEQAVTVFENKKKYKTQ